MSVFFFHFFSPFCCLLHHQHIWGTALDDSGDSGTHLFNYSFFVGSFRCTDSSERISISNHSPSQLCQAITYNALFLLWNSCLNWANENSTDTLLRRIRVINSSSFFFASLTFSDGNDGDHHLSICVDNWRAHTHHVHAVTPISFWMNSLAVQFRAHKPINDQWMKRYFNYYSLAFTQIAVFFVSHKRMAIFGEFFPVLRTDVTDRCACWTQDLPLTQMENVNARHSAPLPLLPSPFSHTHK